MTAHVQSFVLVVTAGLVLFSCSSRPSVSSLKKEVLLQEDGQDRHWVMRADGMIMEEHYLTAHGDLHVVVEYPKGVHNPQVDARGEKENVESVVKGFWRNGKRMSATPQVAEKANGRDLVWWPSGSIAREALFVMGTPTGTWKFYNESGQVLWEGTYKNGKRWSGTFIGSERPGADFFLTMYPMKKITFGGGVLLHEEEFLKELRPQ